VSYREKSTTPPPASNGKQESSVGKDDKIADPSDNEEVPDVVLKEIPDAKIYWEYNQSSETAKVYDRKPIKVKCKEGKIYMWCSCGHSKTQPFCDGHHRFRDKLNVTLDPIPWKCRKTGYYWFCNCKKSKKKVFCDGSHLDLPKDPINHLDHPWIKY